MKISRVIAVIFIIAVSCALCMVLFSCGGAHVPFVFLPDADLGNGYFEHLIERRSQYANIYAYLIFQHMRGIDAPLENMLVGNLALQEYDGDFDFLRASYINWRNNYPDKLEVVRENVPALFQMMRRITRRNMMVHFDEMQNVIESYVSALYINSPAPPRILTRVDEHGNEYEEIAPQIDLEYARSNLARFVCPDFLAKNPQQLVADYLNKHNIHVRRIIFDEILSGVDHLIYPFMVIHRFQIFYHKGSEPIEDERRWRSRILTVNYYLGIDGDGNYIIKYVSDPRHRGSVEHPDDPSPYDFFWRD